MIEHMVDGHPERIRNEYEKDALELLGQSAVNEKTILFADR
jgi:hypothetical protein